MKYIFYLTIFVATMIMMVSAAPSSKKECHAITDPHANSVCKKYCGKAGFLLGECGKTGICICKKKNSNKKKVVSKKKTTSKKH